MKLAASVYYNLFKRMISASLMLIAFTSVAHASPKIISTRIWPANEYTRITIEINQSVQYQFFALENPQRLVLDIDGVIYNEALKSLPAQIESTDPYIKKIRISQYKENVVRLVIDLKVESKPNVFDLNPAGEYQNRLVIDVYPKQAQKESNREVPPEKSMDKQLDTVKSNASENTAQDNNAKKDESAKKDEINGKNEANDKNKSKPIIEPLPNNTTDSNSDSKAKKDSNDDENEFVKPSKHAKNGRKILTIAVDAGHGGEDPGAKGENGSREKDITLAIAKKLKARIDDEPGMRAILIRDGDYFVPLGDRVKKARAAKADLFISIHADSFINSSAKGSSVFALSQRGATSASARYLAQKENEADLIGGVSLDHKDIDLAKTLLDLSQTATIHDSIRLGKAVLKRIGQINRLHTAHVEQAAFAVLKSPDIPSILVETAFISNPDEERKLNNNEHRDTLVSAILAGVKSYLSTNPSVVGK